MLTQNEAHDRATKIWGAFHALINHEHWWEIQQGVGPQKVSHVLDRNGHTMCHEECQRLESNAFATRPIPTPSSPVMAFVKLSERRYLLVEISLGDIGWRATKDKPRIGYLTRNAKIIHGPADWQECHAAAERRATETNRLVTYDAYEQEYIS